MTKYIDMTGEIKAARVDIYGRPITDEAVPKFIVEGESPPQLRKPKWRAPKLLEFAYPKRFKTPQDILNWKRALRLDPGGGNVGELSPTDHLVGTAIIEHHNRETGQCNPSYDLLALELGLSRSTIERSVKKLVQRGWFHVERRKNKSNRFRPTYPAAIEAMLRTRHGYDATQESGNVKSESGNVTAMTSGNVTAMTSEPSIEPSSIEPRGHDPVFQDASKLSGERLRELDARLRIAERQKRLQSQQFLKNLFASARGGAQGLGNGGPLEGPASLSERQEFAAPKTGGRAANGPSTICRTWRYQSKLFELEARTACVDPEVAFNIFDKRHVAEVHSENEWDGMWRDFLLKYAGKAA